MLIFQINQNKKDDLSKKDWLFWNNYLAGRAQADDYVLLPSFIDYIQNTNQDYDNYLVELEPLDDSENDDEDGNLTI